MRTTIPRLLLGLALAGSLALTGCGGDDDESSSPADETTSASETTTDAPSESSEPTAPETEADTATEAPEGGGDDGDKPSREDVIAGYEEIITSGTSAELPADIVTQTATCFVDELYDVASAQTLQAIADAEPTSIDTSDAALFGDAGAACASAGAN